MGMAKVKRGASETVILAKLVAEKQLRRPSGSTVIELFLDCHGNMISVAKNVTGTNNICFKS